MKKVFLDESGECSFSHSSIYRHFLITILSIDDSEMNIIKKKLKREFAHIIKNGWDKTKEIKASDLYRNKKFGAESVKKILKSLIEIKSIEFSYIIVNKEEITNVSFRNASYGIGYNYFTGVILSELIFQDGFHNIHLIYDLRNKETHQKRHFKQYLETKIYGMALESGIPVEMKIEGLISRYNYGLQAVDFCSWAIYRKFEYNDDKFYDLLKEKMKIRSEWYLK